MKTAWYYKCLKVRFQRVNKAPASRVEVGVFLFQRANQGNNISFTKNATTKVLFHKAASLKRRALSR